MRLPTDRGLRALVLAALEDIATAEQLGAYLRAIPALDTLTSELRRRASGPSPIEGARADRDLADQRRGRS